MAILLTVLAVAVLVPTVVLGVALGLGLLETRLLGARGEGEANAVATLMGDSGPGWTSQRHAVARHAQTSRPCKHSPS